MPAWLKALAALCLAAVVANTILVWKALGSKHDLVRKDYYQAGLDQDGRMARAALAETPGLAIAFVDGAQGFRVEVSGALSLEALRSRVCRAYFYRPDDGRADRTLDLVRRDGETAWVDPHSGLRRGLWQIHLTWFDGERPVMEKTFRYFSPG